MMSNNLSSALKSIFSDPVTSCPKNEKEWNDSSLLLKCNDTHSYHCSPYLTNDKVYQLYEFCYRSINVSKGKYCNAFFSK